IGRVNGALVIQYLRGRSNWVRVNVLGVEGVLLTVVLLVDPEGLAGIVTTGVAWLRRKASPPGGAGASVTGDTVAAAEALTEAAAVTPALSALSLSGVLAGDVTDDATATLAGGPR